MATVVAALVGLFLAEHYLASGPQAGGPGANVQAK